MTTELNVDAATFARLQRRLNAAVAGAAKDHAARKKKADKAKAK